MSFADIGELIALMVSAWVFGFSMGYTITKYKDAISQIG